VIFFNLHAKKTRIWSGRATIRGRWTAYPTVLKIRARPIYHESYPSNLEERPFSNWKHPREKNEYVFSRIGGLDVNSNGDIYANRPLFLCSNPSISISPWPILEINWEKKGKGPGEMQIARCSLQITSQGEIGQSMTLSELNA